jgi:hypothetical protein
VTHPHYFELSSREVFGPQIEQEGKNFGIKGIPLYVRTIMVIGVTNSGIIGYVVPMPKL